MSPERPTVHRGQPSSESSLHSYLINLICTTVMSLASLLASSLAVVAGWTEGMCLCLTTKSPHSHGPAPGHRHCSMSMQVSLMVGLFSSLANHQRHSHKRNGINMGLQKSRRIRSHHSNQNTKKKDGPTLAAFASSNHVCKMFLQIDSGTAKGTASSTNILN